MHIEVMTYPKTSIVERRALILDLSDIDALKEGQLLRIPNSVQYIKFSSEYTSPLIKILEVQS